MFKFKNILSFFVLAFLFTGCLSTNDNAERDVKDKSHKTFMWKHSNATGNVYILGSIHVATEDLYPLDYRIDEAFNNSDHLVVEYDIRNIDNIELQKIVIEKGIYTDKGKSLKTEIDYGIYKGVAALAEEFKIDLMQLDMMKPWNVAINLMSLKLQTLGYRSDHGIDWHFLINSESKKVHELESISEQISVFADMPDILQKEYLYSIVKSLSNFDEKYMDNLYNYWETGDVDKLEKMLLSQNIFSNKELSDEFYTRLNKSRNIKMVDKIVDYIDSGENYFIVVGALHLIGKDGIISILKNKGYNFVQQ